MTALETLRSALQAGAAVVAIAAPAPALAQAVTFNIPSRDLDGALQQFAVATDREILYAPVLVANRRSPGLVGQFTPEEALKRLLTGTNLEYRRVSPKVFVLQRGSGPVVARTSINNMQEAPGTPTTSARAPIGQGSLSGVARDAATGTPLAGARVSIEGTNLSTATDERGVYRFPAIPAGDYVVVFDYLGDPLQRSQVTVAAGEAASGDFMRGAGEETDIVVVGYASAIQRALNEQRTAPNASTVVSEDFLGGFPAETVSEALRRVPGVAFGRDPDSGEGSRITVRGFSSEAINVQVNGLELNGTNFERTIDLGGYLADNISKITIHKTLLPSHESTGSGGLVQIETRSGLDYGKFQFTASVEGERPVESGFGREYQANATLAGRLTPSLGIAASVAYRDTNRRGFDQSVLDATPQVLPAGFTSVFTVPFDQTFPFDEEFNSRLVTNLNVTDRVRDETSLLLGVNLAWDVADHTRLRLDAQRNELESFNFTSRTAIAFLTGGFDMPIPELGGEVRRRTVLNSFRPSIAPRAVDKDRVTTTVSLRGDTNIDRWRFKYKAGYSGTRERADTTNITLLGNTFANLTDIIDPATIQTNPDDNPAQTPRVVSGGIVELPNGAFIPSFTQAGFDILLDPANYRVLSGNRAMLDSQTDGLIGELSARYSPETWLDYIEAGAKYDRVERSAIDDLFATTSQGTLRNVLSISAIGNQFVSDLNPALIGSGNLSGVGLGFPFPVVSAAANEAFFDLFQSMPDRFRTTDLSEADPITTPGALQPASSVDERLSGYLETHLEFGRFDAILGARVERLTRSGATLAIPSVTLNEPAFRQEPRTTFIEAGLIDFLNVEAVDTTITPSFLINYRPTSNIVARLGYFRSTVLPSIQALRRPNQIFIDLRPNFNRVILREGNPDLRPTVTDNWDLDLAYYFQDSPGLVRAGLFYKKVANNFTNLLVQDAPAAEVRDRVLDRFGDLATTRPDLVAFNDDTEFLLSRPINAEGGRIYGFELEAIRQFNFLPGWLSGFGVIGNVTYTAADFPTLVSGRDAQGEVVNVTLDRPLEDQAAWVWNAALTYSRGGFEGRAIYTKQTESVVTYEVHDLNTVIPGYSTLDLRLSYNFKGPGGALYTLFLEGDDLLRDADDPDIRNATANSRGRGDSSFFFPNSLQFGGGRTVTLGARVRF